MLIKTPHNLCVIGYKLLELIALYTHAINMANIIIIEYRQLSFVEFI